MLPEVGQAELDVHRRARWSRKQKQVLHMTVSLFRCRSSLTAACALDSKGSLLYTCASIGLHPYSVY
jgi:hypothetical protein